MVNEVLVVAIRNDMERQIKRLQDNLLSIRKIARWTAEFIKSNVSNG